MAEARGILIQGARTHNLKNVTCTIPHGQLTVITGPSGSGKSSLAFDTLYAEGQRRFMESMSTYARQFLERMEKPDVDKIQYILPAIALEQKNHIKNARSTVGTATEIYDYLRMLYGTIGVVHCPVCGGVGGKATPASIETELKKLPSGTKVVITAPVNLNDFSVASLKAAGYFRAWQEGEIIELETLPAEIVIDRLILPSKRLSESLKKALELNPHQIHVQTTQTLAFSTRFSCTECHTPLEEPTPTLFSFNNPLGACQTCEGFGRIIGLDLDKVIPNRRLSLREGAVHPFTTPSNQEHFDELIAEGKKRKIPLDVPFEQLNDAAKTFVLNGAGQYPGVYQFFEWLESKKYKVHVRVMLAKYRGYYLCPQCHGSRLRPEALLVMVNGKTILDLTTMPVSDLQVFLDNLVLTPEQAYVTDRIRRDLHNRLKYLNTVGLNYLTLARQSRTLSGGEAQRINLSTAIGSVLTDTLYVLDEPTVGLHARDTQRLITVLKALRDYGNTLAIVEHDPEMILAADTIIDMGPAAGREGGYIVYEGQASAFLDCQSSPTANYLKHPPSAFKKDKVLFKKESTMQILGAYGNNLKHVDVSLPKNKLVCVSGVSGSGKSTLIKQTLYVNYQQSKGKELNMDAAPCLALEGFEDFADIVLVDQSPPGRSVRSNPVTYVKAYDEIRRLFAQSRQAQALGVTAGEFSFNSHGGRCETCEGLGTLTIDMQFMADVTVICQDCQGKRFSPAVLAIELEGKNINEVLNMTIDEALGFFARYPRVVKKLMPLREIGLGYLHLGQTTSTLSGGEAQRLKLASYLSERESIKPTLFLFDEPTTGLHVTDIQTLIAAFYKLLEAGHSIIVVEHNMDFLAQVDWIIDMGPEGGENGGCVIAEGTPEDIAKNSASVTGQFLKERQHASLQPR